MRTKIVKWGNSLGLRIPKSFAEDVHVAADSVVDLSVEDGKLVIRVPAQPHQGLEDFLDHVTDENRHGEVGTGGAVGGEVW